MKRLIAILLMAVLLSGCAESGEMDRAVAMRERLLAAGGCTFDAEITADYGEKVFVFSVSCQTDRDGNLNFTVQAPETIAGITGTVSTQGGNLTFDGNALAFALLADGQVSPVSAPWILISALRGGYLTSCGADDAYLRLAIDDSYEEDALHLDVWLDSTDAPVRGEILWAGRRIVSLEVKNYTLL